MKKQTPKMKPNAKELSRADNGFTAVVRPNPKGGWNVVIVSIYTFLPVFKVNHAQTKEEIAQIIADDLRMMDKCGYSIDMAEASRDRNY